MASLEINGKTLQTSVDKVFSGGDCVTGPATVVASPGTTGLNRVLVTRSRPWQPTPIMSFGGLQAEAS